MKPNRHKYQTIQLLEEKRRVVKSEATDRQAVADICLNCSKPECKHGWCEKLRQLGDANA